MAPPSSTRSREDEARQLGEWSERPPGGPGRLGSAMSVLDRDANRNRLHLEFYLSMSSLFSGETGLVIARRWCWRQSEPSAAVAQTQECLITVEAHHDTGQQDIEAAQHDLLALLKEYAGGTTTSAILDAHHPALICSLPE